MGSAKNYEFQLHAPGHQSLTFDAYTGEIRLDLSERDAIYWSNYLTALGKGIIQAVVRLTDANPKWAVVPKVPGVIAIGLNLTAVLVNADNAATPRDAVQILTSGLASALITVSAGYYTGLLAAGLPLVLANLGLAFPTFLVTLGVLATVGGAAYAFEQLIDSATKLIVGEIAGGIYDLFSLDSPLLQFLRDPLVLDLDGNGIDLVGLNDSNVHFDYDGDGFAGRTGWVSGNDGILVMDANGNGRVDGAVELFGSPTMDGLAVLETYDSNGDGRIDARDDVFGQLRIWQDFNGNGVSDDGELMTLEEAGIASIDLNRIKGTGNNAGHTIGYEVSFTRTDGTTGTAQTIYFETDSRSTQDEEALEFTPAEGVKALPQLPGSGQIHSIAFVATQDEDFKLAWEQLTDEAGSLSRTELRSRFEDLMLRWAGVADVAEGSRGYYVDARHLTFVERFFGTGYNEVQRGQIVSTSPTQAGTGATIEASFDQIVDTLLTLFLSQVTASVIVRDGDWVSAISSPYFFYSLLNFHDELPEGMEVPETPGNIGAVLQVITDMMPEEPGAAAVYLEQALSGLDGVVTMLFSGDRAAWLAAADDALSSIEDSYLRLIASEIIKGAAGLGSDASEGIRLIKGDNVFIGGKGDDLLVSAEGSDLFVYSRGDGTDYIRDTSASLTDTDTLLLTDLQASDLTFERNGDALVIKIKGSDDRIISDDFFRNWDTANYGIDQIRFADGSTMDRDTIFRQAISVGSGNYTVVSDTTGDDTLRGGKGDQEIRIGQGNDTIFYAAGDGSDTIVDSSSGKGELDRLVLAGLNPDDIELSRSGNALTIKILSTGEKITDRGFFEQLTDPSANDGRGIDVIVFDNGTIWNRAAIIGQAWIRGNEGWNTLTGTDLDDVFIGKGSSDTLVGGKGSDTYIWRSGDGSDTITDHSKAVTDMDRLLLQDITSDNVRLTRQGDDLLITILSTAEVIRITGQYSQIDNLKNELSGGGVGVEEILFADGRVWGRQTIANQAGKNSLGKDIQKHFLVVSYSGSVSGSELVYNYFEDEFGNRGDIYNYGGSNPTEKYGNGYDVVFGSNGSGLSDGDIIGNGGFGPLVDMTKENQIQGKKGDDLIYGSKGNDIIYGDEGDDILYGGTSADNDRDTYGHDVLFGGKGNDTLYGGAGSDNLYGEEGNDRLFGGIGSDYLFGGDGDNWLDGGDGDDYLMAGNGDDVIIGGMGDDYIVSATQPYYNGNDTFIYNKGDGNDIIEDRAKASYDKSIDTLYLRDLTFNEIELHRPSGSVNLVVRVLATGETITVLNQFSESVHTPGIGIERIQFADGIIWDRGEIFSRAWYRGTNGDDTIYMSNSIIQDENDKTAIGGKGDDHIVAAKQPYDWHYNGNNTFIYNKGDGNDIIEDRADASYDKSIDTLYLRDLTFNEIELHRPSGSVNLVVRVLATGETITILNQFSENVHTPGIGIERIQFADGIIWDRGEIFSRAWYRGTNGDDTIYMSNSIIQDENDKTAIGGKGDDHIVSARQYYHWNYNGNDTFIYNKGDGNDIIEDRAEASYDKSIDTLYLRDLTFNEIELLRSGKNLLVKIVETGETITVLYQFSESANAPGTGIEQIRFVDGAVWNRTDIFYWATTGSRFYSGTYASDTIIGSHFDQRLSGGTGNDYIDGKEGSDIIFGDAGDDTLAISVSLLRDIDELDGGIGNDTLTFKDFGFAIHVDLVKNGGEARTSYMNRIDLDETPLIATLNSLENVTGSAFDDMISGNDGANILGGEAGNDILDGRSGNDTLIGGKGDDILIGYLGSDTYVYASGDGNDTICETVAEAGAIDALRFRDIDPSRIVLTRQDGNLLIVIQESAEGAGDGGSIAIVGPRSGCFHYDEYGIERIEFDNGLKWDQAYLRQLSIAETATDGDDVLVGTSASGTFEGGRGDDLLQGGGGNDTYIYSRGDGNDTIIEATNGGSNDRLVFTDINPSDITLIRNGIDVKLIIAESAPGTGDGGSILLKANLDDYYDRGIDGISFADGTEWTRATLRQIASASDVTHQGESGYDALVGSSGNDTLDGGAGEDTLTGGSGSDTYRWGVGYGNDTVIETSGSADMDVIQLIGLNAGDVTFSRQGNDLFVANVGMGEVLKVKDHFYSTTYGIEQVKFADGTIWDRAQIQTAAWHRGTDGNDALAGSSDKDTLDGGAGNDTLKGGSGSDTYRWGGGYGNDTVIETSGSSDTDLVQLIGLNAGAVMFSRQGNDLFVANVGTGEVLKVKDHFYSMSYGVEQIQFADGTIWDRTQIQKASWIRGTDGNDAITGTSSADILCGKAGNDTLTGGLGSDTFIFRPDFGRDVITDFKAGGGSDDVLEFDHSLFADFEAVLAAAAQIGSDTVITYDADNAVTLKNVALTSLHQDDVRFLA